MQRGRLLKVFKSVLIECKIFKIENTTKLEQNNSKHYSQVLHLLGKVNKKYVGVVERFIVVIYQKKV